MPNAYQGRVKQLEILSAATMFLGLYTDATPPDLARVYTSYSQPTFTGYSPATPTWDTVALNGSNDAETNFTTPITFTVSATAGTDIVYGAFIYHWDGANGHVYDWLNFPAPVTMDTLGQFITLNNWRWRQGALAP